jgi:hypothetical protein
MFDFGVPGLYFTVPSDEFCSCFQNCTKTTCYSFLSKITINCHNISPLDDLLERCHRTATQTLNHDEAEEDREHMSIMNLPRVFAGCSHESS